MEIFQTFFGLLLQGLINFIVMLISPIFEGMNTLIFGPNTWWNGDPAEIHQMFRIAMEVAYPIVSPFNLTMPIMAFFVGLVSFGLKFAVSIWHWILDLIPVAR